MSGNVSRVTDGLQVSPGTGLSVNVAPGGGFIRAADGSGSWLFISDAVENRTLTAPGPGLLRVWVIAARVSDALNQGQIAAHNPFDQPSGTPYPYGLSGTWEATSMVLAVVKVVAGQSSIAAGDIRDVRPLGPFGALIGNGPPPADRSAAPYHLYVRTTGSPKPDPWTV